MENKLTENKELREKIINYLEKVEKNQLVRKLGAKTKSLLLAAKQEYDEVNKVQKDYQELILELNEEEKKELFTEIKSLELKKTKIIEKIKEKIIEEENISQNITVEIRPGPGGEEAGLFVNDLYGMYAKFAGKKAGVHRVQRVPLTAKRGEIHTSTATVVILPEPQEIAVKLNPQNLKIDTYRSSGAGGQHVNTTDSAVRLTYTYSTNGKIETVIATSQDGRSQHDNREKALTVLKSRLWEKLQSEQEKKLGNLRSSMIGTAERSENFRTYNFPDDRVTDKRLKIKLHNLDSIMEGDLEEICQKSIDYEQSENEAPKYKAEEEFFELLPEEVLPPEKPKEENDLRKLEDKKIEEEINKFLKHFYHNFLEKGTNKYKERLKREIKVIRPKKVDGRVTNEATLNSDIKKCKEIFPETREAGIDFEGFAGWLTESEKGEKENSDKVTMGRCDTEGNSIVQRLRITKDAKTGGHNQLRIGSKSARLDEGGHGNLHDEFTEEIDKMIKKEHAFSTDFRDYMESF
ncbi:17148_t:CDS:2 [Funneliformis geosporum]|nr:17148_t:CDS:2 [Funneliformis geosporum]